MLGYNGGDKSMGIYKNNIAFTGTVSGSGPGTQAAGNSWNLSPAPAASDFIGIDTAGVFGPRKANGDLPNVKFMHLAGDKYVDKGVDVGLPFTGTAPDIGAFEVNSVSVKGGKGRQAGALTTIQYFSDPFNSTVIISYQLSTEDAVTLKIYNALGHEITTLMKERMPIGCHAVDWHTGLLPGGVYVARLQAGTWSSSNTVLLVK